jgi:predicted phage tail protein
MNALNSIPENRYLELEGHPGNPSSSASASGNGTGSNTNTFQQGSANTTNNSASHSANGSTGSNSEGSLDLERQKAINANLQQQISENIRRQEELVRQMEERGKASAPNAPTPSTVSSAPGPRSMPDASAMQMAGQQMQGNNMHMQGNNMHMQGNGMNSISGAPYGMNFNGAQNGHNRQEHGDVIQSSGGQYNPFMNQQGTMVMESPMASLEHSAAVMSNSNQQLARLLAANPSHPQLSRLLAANPSLFASFQQQQQQSTAQPFGVSSAPVGGYHPSMPPPNSNSLSGNSNSGPSTPPNAGNRGTRNGDDSLLPDSPLSPGSFHW